MSKSPTAQMPGMTDTGIPLTPRILSGMLTGGRVLGLNWAARYADIDDADVPENATVPTIVGPLSSSGDDILAALLPPQILAEITADETMIDHVRDGVWNAALLDKISNMLVADGGAACEEIYERCAVLMTGANTVAFHWNANYIVHMLAVSDLDNAYVRKAAQFYSRFADSDPVGGLFALFLLALLGPVHFDYVIEKLSADAGFGL